jgi:hypothetical protein
MRFSGVTVLRVENGKIAEEIGLDDGCDRAAAAWPAPRGLTVHHRTAAGDTLAAVSRQEDAA